MGADGLAGERRHDRRIGREAAPQCPDGRAGRVDVEVDDRGEVEVDPRAGEPGRHGVGPGMGRGQVVAGAHLGFGQRRRVAVAGIEPSDLAALLVDRHDQARRPGRGPQGPDQRAELARRGDVPTRPGQLVVVEQDHPAKAAVRDRANDPVAARGRLAPEADDEQGGDEAPELRVTEAARGRCRRAARGDRRSDARADRGSGRGRVRTRRWGCRGRRGRAGRPTGSEPGRDQAEPAPDQRLAPADRPVHDTATELARDPIRGSC